MSEFTNYPNHGGKVKLKRCEQPKDYFGNMLKYRRKVHSQHGEDGILEEIFKMVSLVNLALGMAKSTATLLI